MDHLPVPYLQRHVQPRQQGKQRRLAAAGSTRDGVHVSRQELRVHAVQGMDSVLFRLVCISDIADL